jgi:hypothetical protein
VIQGRERPTRWGKTHCLKNDIATLLAERGYSIYPTLCQSAEQSCEYFSECKYIRQFSGEYDVRIFSHAYLALDRGFLDSDLPDYAVIDETFYSTLIAGVGVNAKPTPLSEIKTSVLPTELKKALVLAPTNKPLLAYLRSELGEDELISTIDDALLNISEIELPKLIGLPQRAQLEIAKEIKSVPRVQKLLEVIRDEIRTGRDTSHGVVVSDQGFQVRYRKPITRFRGEQLGVIKKVPVLSIDADLTPAVHNQFFPDTEHCRIATERKCRVVQCYSTQNSKASLTAIVDKGAKKRIAEIQALIDREAANKRLLVVGPMSITGNPEKTPALVKVPENSALEHFNALRGIDKYKRMDAILVISRNQPAMDAAESLACALWFDADEPITTGAIEPQYEPRGYRTRSGYKVGVNVAVHPVRRSRSSGQPPGWNKLRSMVG